MKTGNILILLLTMAFLLLSSCGPSPEEIATQTASAWTSTPVPPTSTPTPTPVPYDLTISVEDLEGNIITDAEEFDEIILVVNGTDCETYYEMEFNICEKPGLYTLSSRKSKLV